MWRRQKGELGAKEKEEVDRDDPHVEATMAPPVTAGHKK